MEEDEAALLAELKAISNRSATSRFDGEEDTPSAAASTASITNDRASVSKTPPPSVRAASPKTTRTPTTGSGRKDPTGSVVHSPSRRASPAPRNTTTTTTSRRSPSPSASNGRRSSSNPRRAASPVSGRRTPPIKPPSTSGNSKMDRVEAERRKSEDLSHFNPTTATATATTAAAEPSYGIKSDLPSTFQGERGGSAEDAELLAELRKISSQSSNRFQSEDESNNDDKVTTSRSNNNGNGNAPATPPRPTLNARRQSSSSASRPRKSSAKPTTDQDESEMPSPPQRPSNSPNSRVLTGSSGEEEEVEDFVVVKGPPPRLPKDSPVRSAMGGFQSDLPSTFQGERGGDAQDAELLAELQAISSGGTNRFADEQNDVPAMETSSKPAKPAAAMGVPPWKQKRSSANGNKKQQDAVVVAEAPPAKIQSNLPNTFQGERGGAAEDEELLAELRAISSGGANRFDDGSSERANDNHAPTPPTMSKSPSRPAPKSRRDSTPPWKRKSTTSAKGSGSQNASSRSQRVEEKPSVVEASPPKTNENAGFGIKSSLPNTFSGERSGAAEDAELLAALRAVSAGTSSRFGSDEDAKMEDSKPLSASAPPKRQSSSVLSDAADTAVSMVSSITTSQSNNAPSDSGEEEVTPENLSTALVSKDWKMRVKSYELLNRLLSDLASKEDEHGNIDASNVLDGLDGKVCTMAEDTNVGALDKALEFLISYATWCTKAGEAETAASLAQSLVKKNGLSSRPSTLKLANELALKLMEVGKDGASSVHAVIDVLLKEGLKSKKPKVVLASASLVHTACTEFGVGAMPLHSVESGILVMFSNTNQKVREIGLKILAELCRAMSKASLGSVLDQMKKAQVTELDNMLDKQPQPDAPKRQLRSASAAGGGGEASAGSVVVADTAELEAQRFAARPAVNLIAVLPKTEYPGRIDHQKWSEKVAALKAALEAGGEKPYKLAQPSSSVNYIPLISKMKELLKHTHFAVVSKAMEVLSMLAEGVGEKLFPQLRPLLLTLLRLSKDKKLTKAVASTMDSFFGNVLSFDHLLDSEDAIPSAVNEKMEKNALARISTLSFLARSIQRNANAGPRSTMTAKHVSAMLSLATTKLDDTDAAVRKEAMSIFHALNAVDEAEFVPLVDESLDSLQSTNPRAYKTLMGNASKDNPQKAAPSTPVRASSMRNSNVSITPAARPPNRAKSTQSERGSKPAARGTKPQAKSLTNSGAATAPKALARGQSAGNQLPAPELEDAVEFVSTLGIPDWDAEEEDGGVLSGLSAAKWTFKNEAIKSLAGFIETGQIDAVSKDVSKNTGSILRLTKEHTRGFKETNVNIMKSILQLFIEVCSYHESAEVPLMEWAMIDGVTASIHKIQDKKLHDTCSQVLTSLCVVCHPCDVMVKIVSAVEAVKSPIAHENVLKWFALFCKDFGASSLGKGLSDVVPWLLQEASATNPKVKKEALACISASHKQLGPTFKALTLQLSGGANQSTLEQVFETSPFDPNEASLQRSKRTMVTSKGEESGEEGGRLTLEVPKTDLSSLLDARIVGKLNSKEGKTAWKMRKEAIEEVSVAMKSCNGLLDTSTGPKMKFLVEVSRALKDRLADTQINLRPLAARTITDLLSSVDKSSQARLGKILFPALVNSSMHDIKKPVRDTTIEALSSGVKTSSLEGSAVNGESLEILFLSFTNEFNDTALRSTGLADLLACLQSYVKHLPNFMEISSTQGSSLGEKYSNVLCDCLTSSKSEVRNAALSLLEKSIEHGVITVAQCQQSVDVMKPAKQRSVAPLIANLEKPASPKTAEKENRPATAEVVGVTRKPPSVAAEGRTNSKTSVVSRASARSSASSRAASARRSVQKPSSFKQAPPSKSDDPDGHPLISHTAKNSIPKQVAWPAFPEEPTISFLGSLKRSWSTVLPSSSAGILFPMAGIKKQDDAQEGCELLERAFESDGALDAIENHLDSILKWMSYVLCCKEATVGLQSLLSAIQKLFEFLSMHGRTLFEEEVCIIVPFLIEKTSNAKGRFRDPFTEILGQLQSETLLSPKLLGSIACVQVIERSNHAKARALAFTISRDCVETAGLPGLGKKGVLIAAKSLSAETLPETKAAALDLMEEVVSRMQGDVDKLAKLCGSSLSDKGREAIEERWQKSGSKRHLVTSSPNSSLRRSSEVEGVTPGQQGHRSSTILQSTPGSALKDELPVFNIRGSLPDAASRHRQLANDFEPSADPFVFSLSAKGAETHSPERKEYDLTAEDVGRSRIANDPVEVARTRVAQETSAETTHDSSGTLGTAAALRARLLKIKEKQKAPQDVPVKNFVDDITAISTQGDGREEYKRIIGHIKALLRRPVPLSQNDGDIATTTRSLKKVHTALTTNEERVEGLTPLKSVLVENMSGLISHIISVIRFSLDCLERTESAGISIPILSVSLATLMALFRPTLNAASQVAQDDLTALLREAATILLDPRFSAESDLDDATCAQMAKAINKTAVNAATGSPRHVSIQSLITVQQQLALENSDDLPETTKDFTGRLSRVISRLFARVIKAEEAANTPYDSTRIDMESMVCTMEDTLEGCHINKSSACEEMVSDLVKSILKSHGGLDTLYPTMEQVGISSTSSSLASLIDSLSPEVHLPPRNDETFYDAHDISDSVLKTVSELVTALGNSKEGTEREAALANLRRHKEEHGADGLNSYLQELSPAFRKFIEEQLATTAGLSSPSNSETSHNMSERLKQLRSRLQSSSEQVAVDTSTAVHYEGNTASSTTTNRSVLRSEGLSVSTTSLSTVSAPRRPSRLAQPSPRATRPAQGTPRASRLTQPSPARSSLSSPSRRSAVSGSVRDRLAATSAAASTHSTSSVSSSGRSTAAANLRARLEAVKKQGNK